MTTPADLDRVREIAAADHGLAVVVTRPRRGRDPQVSVVNAGILAHPVSGAPVVGLVSRPGAKVRNLRADPRATLVFRAGWQWVAVRGPAELVGPDDPHPDLGPAEVARLLRAVYHAAGGSHPDLDEYDRVMAAERRVAVLVAPERVWPQPPGG